VAYYFWGHPVEYNKFWQVFETLCRYIRALILSRCTKYFLVTWGNSDVILSILQMSPPRWRYAKLQLRRVENLRMLVNVHHHAWNYTPVKMHVL